MKKILAGLACVFCSTIPAFGQQIATQYDRSVNFASYRTYKWVGISGAEQPDQITASNIVNLVNAQLAAKGLTLTENNPDLFVGFQTALSREKQLNYWGSGWGFGGFGQATTSTVHVGELIVDMYAASSKTLVWRGSATNTLNPSANADKNYKNLQKAVGKLLKKFPPQ